MTIIATGFVADTPDVASDYPSAGANSSSEAFQAIYWRCIAVFMFSAALNARGCRRVLFSNVAAPVVDGIDLGDAFARIGAETVHLPLRHRLPGAKKWGNVFYFLDILHYLPADARLALFDSDVVLTRPVAPLIDRIGRGGIAGYAVDTQPHEDVNGMTMAHGARLAEVLGGPAQPSAILHLGGEFLGLDLARMQHALPVFDALWNKVANGIDGMDAIRTEEHFWSVAAAAQGWLIDTANDQVKRMWTARNHRTVAVGDETLPVWHLPAEKRYGFVDLFRWIARRGFDPNVDPTVFHAAAARCFGIPAPSPGKRVRDLARGVRHRLQPNA